MAKRDDEQPPTVPNPTGSSPTVLAAAVLAPTVFDKIISGEIPSHRIHEDEHVIAFLDINPLSPGHMLVVPRERKAHLHQLSDDAAAALGRVLPRLCRAVMQATGTSAYNVLQNNGVSAHQAVMHVHVHIIPRSAQGGLDLYWETQPFDAPGSEKLAATMRDFLRGER